MKQSTRAFLKDASADDLALLTVKMVGAMDSATDDEDAAIDGKIRRFWESHRTRNEEGKFTFGAGGGKTSATKKKEKKSESEEDK